MKSNAIEMREEANSDNPDELVRQILREKIQIGKYPYVKTCLSVEIKHTR